MKHFELWHVKRYLAHHAQLREIRAWLRAPQNNADAIAAGALWKLNRHARGAVWNRETIYWLKSDCIKLWYERGLCSSVSLQEQALACWHTRGYNNGWDDYCDKCNNTGVYRRHELYRFVFEIGGRFYSWHQPKGLVKFDVRIAPGAPMTPYEAKSDWRTLDDDYRKLLLDVVREYLSMNGVEICSGAQRIKRTLWDEFVSDYINWLPVKVLYHWLYRAKSKVRDWRVAAEDYARAFRRMRYIGSVEDQGDYDDDRVADDEPVDQEWLCSCGHYQEDGLHCDDCGREQPWGCDCSCCHDKYTEEDEDYDYDEEITF